MPKYKELISKPHNHSRATSSKVRDTYVLKDNSRNTGLIAESRIFHLHKTLLWKVTYFFLVHLITS